MKITIVFENIFLQPAMASLSSSSSWILFGDFAQTQWLDKLESELSIFSPHFRPTGICRGTNPRHVAAAVKRRH